jgi:hypothetical protein
MLPFAGVALSWVVRKMCMSQGSLCSSAVPPEGSGQPQQKQTNRRVVVEAVSGTSLGRTMVGSPIVTFSQFVCPRSYLDRAVSISDVTLNHAG